MNNPYLLLAQIHEEFIQTLVEKNNYFVTWKT